MTQKHLTAGVLTALSLGIGFAIDVPPAGAHGGRFLPPATPPPFAPGGSLPPTGLPPPPTTPPGGGPGTGPGTPPTPPAPPPLTGGGIGGGLETGGGGGMTPAALRRARTRGVMDTGGWERWWDANRASLVGRKTVRTRVTTDSPLFHVGGGESGNRPDAERPTVRAIEQDILPTLRWVVDAKNRCDPDTISAGYLAIGKVARSETDVRLLLDACRRRGDVAVVHESAVLALGCLRRTDRPADGSS